MAGDERLDTQADPQGRLQSWKEIASYLQRGVSTAQRWARAEGLPVHRLPHAKAGTVFAYRTEIDSWWRERSARIEAAESEPPQARAVAPSLTDRLGVCRLIWWDRELVLQEGENILGRGPEAAAFLDETTCRGATPASPLPTARRSSRTSEAATARSSASSGSRPPTGCGIGTRSASVRSGSSSD